MTLAILFCFTLLAAVRLVTSERHHRVLSIGLALIWLALEIWVSLAPTLALNMFTSLAFMVFGTYVIATVLRRVVTAKVVDAEVIFAAVSVYLLIAITWAVSYDLLDLVAPGSFGGAAEGKAASFNGFLYFSLTTLTTLGYGDITPVSSLARIWSTLEAVTGVFYLAILVARLVSLYRT